MNKRKTISNILVLAFIFFSIGLTSCEYKQMEPVVINELPTDVSFSDDIMPIFNASCNMAGCHSEGGISPDLSATNAYLVLSSGSMLDLLTPENSELYKRMIDEGNPMPTNGFGGILDANKTNTVLVWIQEGALDN